MRMFIVACGLWIEASNSTNPLPLTPYPYAGGIL